MTSLAPSAAATSADRRAVGLAGLDAVAMTRGYADGSFTPLDVAEAVLRVIDVAEPELNATWLRADPDAVLAAARESTRRWRAGRPEGALDGIPVTLKENVAQAGVPMPAGTAGIEPVVPTVDSPVAARVAEDRGIVVATTVMPDWGMLSSGVSSLHGVTRSAWDRGWTTGGSSSGAGTATAAGYAPLSVGTDIGGSIRLPGTWLGLATLKPSAGRVPLDAPYLGRAAGPMCRSVRDAALFLGVLARPDSRDYQGIPAPDPGWFERLRTLVGAGRDGVVPDVAGLRVGVQTDAGCGLPVAPEVAAAVDVVAGALERAGAQVEVLAPWMRPEWLADLDRFWRVRSLVDLEALPPERQDRVLPFIRRWVRAAAGTSGEEVMRCYSSVMQIQRATCATTEAFDLVLSPVAPMTAFPAHWPMPWGEGDEGMAHIGFTAPYNMSGQPAGTVNAAFTDEGKPVGVQLAGRRWDDLGVLAAMAWWEATRPDGAQPRWPVAAGLLGAAADDEGGDAGGS